MSRAGTSLGATASVLGAAVLFGTSATAVALFDRTGEGDAPPLAVAAVRLLIGAAVLVAASRAGRNLNTGPAPRRPLRREPLLAGVALGMAGYQVLFFLGVSRAGVAVGTVASLALAPFVAGILGRWLGAGSLGKTWWFATAGAVIGLVLLVGPGRGVPIAGVLAAVAAGFAYAVFTASSGELARRGHDSVRILGVGFALAALLTLPLLIGRAGWLSSTAGILLALYLGVVATGCAYILFGRALGVLQPGLIATLNLAEPVTATVLGVGILGEELGLTGFAGAAIIIAALVVAGLQAGTGQDGAHESVPQP